MIAKPKQRYLGRTIGGLRLLAQRSVFYISFLNFFMILTLYCLRVREIRINAFGMFTFDLSVIPFWLFLTILMVIFGLMLIIDYVYILPSEMSFIVWQQYRYNPIVQDIRRLEERIEAIESKLNQVMELLSNFKK